MRDGHREHRHSAKDERMKDRASHGSGRSSRRDDDDDRNIREKDKRRIKDDAYRDADGYRSRQSAKGDSGEGASSRRYHAQPQQAIYYLRQQDSSTRKAAECLGMGHR